MKFRSTLILFACVVSAPFPAAADFYSSEDGQITAYDSPDDLLSVTINGGSFKCSQTVTDGQMEEADSLECTGRQTFDFSRPSKTEMIIQGTKVQKTKDMEPYPTKIECNLFRHESDARISIKDDISTVTITNRGEAVTYETSITKPFGQLISIALEGGMDNPIEHYYQRAEINGRETLIFDSQIFVPACTIPDKKIE